MLMNKNKKVTTESRTQAIMVTSRVLTHYTSRLMLTACRMPFLSRGIATGVDIGIYILYHPKSAQVNFLWGKNVIRMAIQQFYTPKTNFWLCPCFCHCRVLLHQGRITQQISHLLTSTPTVTSGS